MDVKPFNEHGSDPVKAGVAIAAGLVVKNDGANGLDLAADGDEGVAGVMNVSIDNSAGTAKTTRVFTYTTRGWVRLVASGAISEGEQIALDDDGKVQALGAGTFNLKVGRAYSEATDDGDVILAYVDFGY